ncbi:MAG TPA: zf-HC2 domain-containing protein [Terriglobales bacterium]|nr:zf-HC2 domain-containing protein [Terriglobales bacterium]
MIEPLNCSQFEERLSDFEEGALAPELAAAMRAHAQACGACAALRQAVRETATWLAELPELELPPALIPAVLARTTGRRELVSWRATLRSLGGIFWQPRVVMGFGMAVFALAVLLNAAGVNLRQLRWRDLTPRQLALSAERGMHRGWARGAKYYNDLKVVYEIQAALQAVQRNQPAPPAAAPNHRNRNQDPNAVFGYAREFASAAPASFSGRAAARPRANFAIESDLS